MKSGVRPWDIILLLRDRCFVSFFGQRSQRGAGRYETPRPWLELTRELYSDWLLGAHRHRREPAVAIALFAADDGVELLLERLCNRPHSADADFDLIDRSDRRYLRGCAGEEHFVGDVKHLPRNRLLNDWNVQVARDLQHRVAGNARENGIAQRRRDQFVAMDEEQVFARAFADESILVQRDPLDVAVGNRFHLDELRVHVIRARLGHRGQRIRRQARPGRNTDVDAFTVTAQIFSPGIVADVNLDRA